MTNPLMKSIPVQEAVGHVLCHDVTRIVPGQSKGRAFKRGHVITTNDIPALLDIGKEHIYVFDLAEGYVHEDDAARRIARNAAGDGLNITEPSEGRVNLSANRPGLLKIKTDALREINMIEGLAFATVHGNQFVTPGRTVAGTRIIPLVIPEGKLAMVEDVCRRHKPIIDVHPLASPRVGIVTTGSEVYHGRIEDRFGPVVREKCRELGIPVLRQILVSDQVELTVQAINDLIAEGAEMVFVTGGMSVDPDDQTPASIRATGAKVVTYGAPIFPGAMFMLAHLGDIPVLGLPGCVMYYRTTVFDLIVPRLLAGENVTREDVAALGHGGFCSGCPECRYPICGFGKSG